MAYALYDWPTPQGRGEFVRLALEEAGAAYVDVAREPTDAGLGLPALRRLLGDPGNPRPAFAPPFLRDGDAVVGQTAAILLYLGPRLGLVAEAEHERIWTHQIQLTIADLVTEVHDTHHPVAVGLAYADQAVEAARRAGHFRTDRLPEFLAWFEHVLTRNGGTHLVGAALSYADLSLFQLVDGLRYAFPAAMAGLLPDHPRVAALHAAVAGRPRIAAYLASPRRMPFDERGIFRCYAELDG